MNAPHDAECTACDGTGEVDEDYADRRGEHCTRTIECTECGGSGAVERDDDDLSDPVEGGEVVWEVAL